MPVSLSARLGFNPVRAAMIPELCRKIRPDTNFSGWSGVPVGKSRANDKPIDFQAVMQSCKIERLLEIRGFHVLDNFFQNEDAPGFVLRRVGRPGRVSYIGHFNRQAAGILKNPRGEREKCASIWPIRRKIETPE